MTTAPSHRSLASRLSLFLGLSSAVLSMAVLGLIAGVYIQRSHAHMGEHAQRTAAFLAESLEYPLWNLDLDAVQAIGQALAQDHVVGLVEVFGTQGETLYIHQTPHAILMERRAKVAHGGQVIGEVRVGLNDLELRSTLWPVVLTGAGLAGLIILLQYLLHRLFFRPLLDKPFASLDRLITAYSAGDFSATPPQTPYAEFASLFGLLADMGRTIERQVDDLKASREQLSLALDAANDGLWDWDVASGKAFFSPRYYTMLGYEPGEFEGGYEAWRSRVHPDDLVRVERVLASCIDGELDVFKAELRMSGKGGQWRWILTRGKVVERAAAGRAQRFVGTHVDITARKELELRLADQLAFQQALMDTIPYAVFYKGADTRFLGFNTAYEEIFGVRREDLLGKRVLDLEYLPPADRAAYQAEDEMVIANVGRVQKEMPIPFADGQVHETLYSVSGFRQADGSPGGLIGVIVDISERKRAEAALRQSEEKFSRLFMFSPDNITLSEMETGRFVEVNESFLRYHGLAREETIGRTAGELGLFVDKRRRRELVEALEGRSRVENFEVEVRRGDGTFGVGSMSSQIVEIGGRSLMMSILRDITETKKMQEVMVQTEKMISVGGIAAGVAHEINNPLGIVLQATQNLVQRTRADLPKNIAAAREIGLDLDLLRRYMQARKLDVFITDIQSAAVRAAAIIRHMLDFSRRSESKRMVCDLPGIVRKAIDLAQSDYDLKKSYDFKRIRIDMEVADDLPEVNCTETEIEQVILNLLRNAAQAMATSDPPVAEPCIGIRLSALPGGVRVEVQDNGPGIPPAIQRRIFEPFFTTKAPGVGTGLGLSVSYFIVTKGHGGSMRVESTPGYGTLFTMDLPTEDART